MRAKKICGYGGPGGCTRLVPNGTRYCDEHRKARQWQGSSIDREDDNARRRTRASILARDPWCRIGYPDICTGGSTQVDRIDHTKGYRDPEGLAGVCAACHARKSSLEAHAARGHRVELPQMRTKPSAPQPDKPKVQIPRTL